MRANDAQPESVLRTITHTERLACRVSRAACRAPRAVQFKLLGVTAVIDRLINRNHHLLALQVGSRASARASAMPVRPRLPVRGIACGRDLLVWYPARTCPFGVQICDFLQLKDSDKVFIHWAKAKVRPADALRCLSPSPSTLRVARLRFTGGLRCTGGVARSAGR